MLVLSRKPGTAITLEVPPSGSPTHINVVLVRQHPTPRIGIEAPLSVRVMREELVDAAKAAARREQAVASTKKSGMRREQTK